MKNRTHWRRVHKSFSEHAYGLARSKLDVYSIAYRAYADDSIDYSQRGKRNARRLRKRTSYILYRIYVHRDDESAAKQVLMQAMSSQTQRHFQRNDYAVNRNLIRAALAKRRTSESSGNMKNRLQWRRVHKSFSEHAFDLAKNKLDIAGIRYHASADERLDPSERRRRYAPMHRNQKTYILYRIYVHRSDEYKAQRVLE